MELKWSDFLHKKAQSIVFGGGSPIGGRHGDQYQLPKQNPIKTIGQLGDTFRSGIREIGRFAGKKTGYDPDVCESVADYGSYLIPVFGMARGSAEALSAINKGNNVEALWDIASTKPLLERLVPHSVNLGYAGVVGAMKGSKYLRSGIRKLINHAR